MKLNLIKNILTVLILAGAVSAERIKDIVDIQGVRSNPLTGVGLVIGLSGTGDTTLPSQQMLTNVLRQSGLVFSPQDMKGRNIAIVIVTAQLGPFSREGSRIDVDVSSIGDAKSLQGGTLLATPLEGLDGVTYAVTLGTGVSLGGWTASGDKASVTKNHQTVARIPDGAIVEKAELATFYESVGGERIITLQLRNNDFTTAGRIGKAINEKYESTAFVADAGTIQIKIPKTISEAELAGFVDEITSFEVRVDMPSIVVINERTGTIVVGENVSISAVAISQGSLVVKIKEVPVISQPTAPFSDAGSTVVAQDTNIGIEEREGFLIPVPKTVTVAELARTLNAIGATPRDLITIFNALKKAGALQARIEIM